MRSAVHYLPILTTVVAAWFAAVVLRRHRQRGGTHLLWWGIGMICYGAGTTTEALTTLLGWQAPVFRLWYITGALLGGAPLAQGTAYLLLSRRTAGRLAVVVGAIVLAGAVAVVLAPIQMELVEAHRLSGRVFGWQWVRLFSPFINLYAVTLLIGGAILSAVRYWKRGDKSRRAAGNALIAVGAILPGIGGSFTRFGHVEVLYVTELVGLLVIYAGYRMIVSAVRSGAGRVSAPLAMGRAGS
ncbi:MAG: hypothetical protein ACRENB_05860 [Gemmatimonadales bacterium]